MNTMTTILHTLLLLAAGGQFCIALINFRLVQIMHWEADLARVSQLVREVFHVHKWFISITLFIFTALTVRFAGEIAAGSEPVYRWIAAGIGFFWAIRAVIQVVYYSSSHWRGIPSRFAVHLILLGAYSGCAAVYLTAAFHK
jgi:hypothetical protein